MMIPGILAQRRAAGGPAPVADPAIRAVRFNLNASGASHSAFVPTGTADGDLLVYFLVRTGTGAMPAPPSGWTKQTVEYSMPAGARAALYYRKWSTGDPTTYTFGTTARAQGLMYAIDGATVAASILVEGSASASGSSSAPDPASINPTWGGSAKTLAIAFYGADTASGSGAATAYPYANWQRTQTLGTTAGNVATGGCVLELATPPVDPSAFTIAASNNWTAATVLVKGL